MTVLVAAVALGLALAQSAGVVEIRDVAPEQYPSVSTIVRVIDERGRAVAGLGKDDFKVLEDGRPVGGIDVRPSFREGGSLAVELLIDTSGSMRDGPLQAAAAAARAFLDRLGPDDRVGLITFGSPPVERAPIGAPAAITGLDQLTPDGYTALYDSISLAQARLASQPARARAIVVLTDGRDDEGDTRSDDRFDRLRLALSGSAIPIHGVGFTSPEFDPGPLRELTALTKGTYRETDSPAGFTALYRQIADELLAEYRISYRSSAAPGPHRVEVRVEAAAVQGKAERAFELAGDGIAPATTVPEPAAESSPSDAIFVVVVAVLAIAAAAAAFAVRRRDWKAAAVRAPAAPEPSTSEMMLTGSGVAIALSRGVIVVGRDPSAQVVIDDPMVSRQHAQLEVTPDGVRVQDLGSANGTHVNGVAVESSVMRPGDILEIGDVRLELRSVAS